MTNLQIISIRSNINSSRVNLELSDSRVLILLADDIYLLKLSKFQEIDDVLYQKIVSATTTLLLRDYALRQVSLSPKNKHILLPKLKLQLRKIINKYSLPSFFQYDQIIDNLIIQLESKKYLSNNDVADYLIRKYSKKSPMYIRQMLLKSGINSLEYLDKLPSSSNQIEEIKRLITKKIKSPLDLRDIKVKQKIIASVFRKGFSLSNINRSIDEMLSSS